MAGSIPEIPRLTDTSLQGRLRFLEEYEAVIWAYWREEFQQQFTSPTRFITHEHLPRDGKTPVEAAEDIAENLIAKLRRPDIKMEFAPAIEDVRAWYKWLVSGRVAWLVKNNLDRIPAVSWRMPEWVGRLVDEWRRVLVALVESTRILTFEQDWLYATVRARRDMALQLRKARDDSAWSEAAARALLARSSSGGSMNKISRTRRGAAAVMRFALVRTATEVDAFDSVRRLYSGPVRPVEDVVPLPAGEVNEKAAQALLRFAQWLWTRIEGIRRDRKASEAVRADAEVMRPGLNRATARLVPAKLRGAVEAGWPKKAGDDSDEDGSDD